MRAALKLSPGDPGLLRATAVADLVWLDAQLKARSHSDLAATVADLQELQSKGLTHTGDMEALLGEAYERLGDSVSSARSFQEAIRLSPHEERFRLALAIELMQHQTYEPALVILKRAEIDFPRSARIRTATALTLYLSGEEKEGIAKLLEAISLDPSFTPAVRYLGEIALGQGTPPEQRIITAECGYADAHPSDSEAAAYCGGLEARAAADNTETADWNSILHRLGSAASRAPENALARCEYGKALYQSHDWARARSELKACVRLDPNSVEGHYRLARVYERFGEKDLARKELAMRAAASSRLAAANDAREESVKGFLYTMGQR
jgi:tetratricopeptide (TPR) repeat protein